MDGLAQPQVFLSVDLGQAGMTGQMTLQEAQKEISTDWVKVYDKLKGKFGSIDNITDLDDN